MKKDFYKKLKNLKILVVDDNKLNQEVIVEMLKITGMQTVVAETGRVEADVQHPRRKEASATLRQRQGRRSPSLVDT